MGASGEETTAQRRAGVWMDQDKKKQRTADGFPKDLVVS